MSSSRMKTIIERGASWTLEETKLLLALWGQDLIQRQSTNAKRSKEVYEKISEKFTQNGFERTPDQVRTRVFNMIAEYRRILKDPNPERMKKCIFYEPLDRIYHAKHMDEIKAILDDYEPEFPCSPSSNTVPSEKGEESVSDGEAADDNDDTNNKSTSGANATNVNTTSTSAANAAQANSNSGSNSGAGGSNVNNNNETSNSTVVTNTSDNTIIDAGIIKDEKESSAPSHQTSSTGTTPAKRIRLDSPKSSHQNQANQSSTATTANSNQTPQDTTTTTPSTSGKQSKSQQATTSVPLLATAIGGTPISSSSTIRTQQSLLMPHGTVSSTPSTSTPITKFTTSANNNTPSYININSTKLPIIRTNQIIGPNGNESINLTNGTATRLPTTAAISHQLYQAPVNTFDVTSSALLIDRMFAHLSRESENMREWIALEKERLAIEKARRQQETEREFRRERVLMDTLMKFQDQWLSFLSRVDPKALESLGQPPPELKIPPADVPQHLSQTTATYSTLSNNTNNNNNNANCNSSTSKQPDTDK